MDARATKPDPLFLLLNEPSRPPPAGEEDLFGDHGRNRRGSRNGERRRRVLALDHAVGGDGEGAHTGGEGVVALCGVETGGEGGRERG